VRKIKLLSTVAAALLLSAGVASAQGMSKDAPERVPAAQQSAPAEKVAPSMKGGEQKAPQTTGQATPELKSGKARETTGQAPKSEADDKTGRTMDKDSKSGAAATGKSDAESGAATTGQGAASGSAKLTTEQHTKITTVIKQQKVEPTRLNVSVSVGTRIPTSVHVYPLPVEVIVIYPEWRGYDYILVGDQIVIINPRTHEIVAIVEA
jgi:hypothetical protein